MKVKELIKQLKQTGINNEVRILCENKENGDVEETTAKLYLSFDDLGDVLIYEIEKD